MAFRDLRRPAADVRQGGGTRGDGRSARPDGGAPLDASRRRFLRRAALGGAVSFGATAIPLSALADAALAQTTGTTPGSTPGTTAASSGSSGSSGSGKKSMVTGQDQVIVTFGQTVELALDELYGIAIDSGKLKAQALQQARAFQLHHREHGKTMAEVLQDDAPNQANQALLASLRPKIDGAATESDLMSALQGVEDGAAATYQWAVGEVEDWQTAGLLGTVEPVEAQHAVAWSRLRQPAITDWLPQFDQLVPVVQSTDGRWDPAQYRVATS